jgi:Ca2+-binding RTX toxin-like protein
VNIEITPATASITVNGYTGVYDGLWHGATGSATGVGGVDLTSFLTLGSSFKDFPGGTANWSFDAGDNYVLASGSVAIAISKANLIVAANNASRLFGQNNPAFSASITGYVNGEVLATSGVSGSANLTTPATQFSPVGNYAINAALGTLAATNYSFSFVNGTLSVQTPTTGFVTTDGNGNLVVIGTGGADCCWGGIVIVAGEFCNNIGVAAVSINGNVSGLYTLNAANNRVIVYSLGGDDCILMIGSLVLEAHGGDGNDSIIGGSANDVLWGDNGNDEITGASGHDVILGGDGADRLVGASGNDILISGDMVGASYGGLKSLMTSWLAEVGNNDSTNVDTAEALANTVDLTTGNDGDVDKLTGASGADLFIISASDLITDIKLKTLVDGATNSEGDVVQIIL